ncbi:MAG: sigma-70 family RNA polymerase sigma factor [Cyanothece sp. SIO1E1]|nr:sigma-70 family RNA polymerase sigma factor [Cyanothece sp. SIO1E1]
MPLEIPQSQSQAWAAKTDEAIFLALQQGDKAALAALYDRYSRLVYTIALRILNNGSEAEDLTQEIFLNLWQKQNYDVTRSSLVRFLSTVTRSRAIDKVRSRGIRYRILNRWGRQTATPDTSSIPIEQASLGERSQRVREALKSLPENQHEVLLLAYYHGFSHSEIAKHTDIPLGTVKYRIRQGLIKLKTILKDLDE